MFNLRLSKWTYDTSGIGSIGFGALLVSGGPIYLTDPRQEQQTFHYGASGVGWSTTIVKLPHVPEIKLPRISTSTSDPSVTGATPSFAGSGAIFMTSAFRGEELSRSDLIGSTASLDAGAGVVLDGGGGSVMLLGINTALLELGMVKPELRLEWLAIYSAPAVLVMVGFNVGTQPGALHNGTLRAGVGFGVDAMIGHLS